MASAEAVPAGLLLLQQEVPGKLVGKLPRVTCKSCKDGRCQEHKPSRCQECGGWLGKHIHLDYVGHAETTSKLLEADPAWTWEPLAFGDDGLPRFDEHGGLWIRLTVCGVTRLGYGTAENAGFKAKGDIRKEIIGDALRNAAMRFGFALNLWAKTEIHERAEVAEAPTVREPKPARKAAAQRSKPSAPAEDEWTKPAPDGPRMMADGQSKALHALLAQKKGRLSDDERHAGFSAFTKRKITSASQLTYQEASALLDFLGQMPDFIAPGVEYALTHSAEEVAEANARGQAQGLAATDPEADPERIEADLRDALESASSTGDIDAAWVRVQAAEKAGAIGAAAVGRLTTAGARREETLKADAGWSHRMLAEQGAAL
jgi:hypothetical protein